MRLRYLIGMCLLIIACEEPFASQEILSGTWAMEITMYENDTLIGKIKGDLVFYVDNTAKLTTNKNDQTEEVLYDWSLQSDHLLLVNQSTKFTLPYRVNDISEHSILLSQAEDVKMKLFR